MLAFSYLGDTTTALSPTLAPETVCMTKSDFNKKLFWSSIVTAVTGGMLTAAISGISAHIEERRHPERVQRRLQQELTFLKRRIENRRMRRR